MRSLESRLHRLENDIQSNHHTIQEIKDLVRQLGSANIKANGLLGPSDSISLPNKFARYGIQNIIMVFCPIHPHVFPYYILKPPLVLLFCLVAPSSASFFLM